MTKRRPTVKDIAAELNLTHPTVSRALADHASISAETKARVEEAARRLGYVANSNARVLRNARSEVVGLLLPDVTNEFYAAVAQRLADDCSDRGRQLVLSISGGDPDRELKLVRALMETRPSVLILALTPEARPETLAYLRGTQCVQFMYPHPELPGPVVTVEDSGGARLAIERLLELGHRRIGFVGPPAESSIGNARLRGLRQALRNAHLELDEDLVQFGPSTSEFGSAATRSLLELPQPPTAIYLSSAPLSLGGVRELSARRVRIPEDLSVVVAGSAAWYDAWPGGLTSITLPMEELTRAASDLALRRDRDETAGTAVTLAFQLIERGSTAAPILPATFRFNLPPGSDRNE